MTSEQFWQLEGNSLVWNVKQNRPHMDNYEMSGLLCDTIVDYGVDPQGLLCLRWCCYIPTLRTIPNDTHATLEVTALQDQLPQHVVDGKAEAEYPNWFRLDGTLTVESRTECGISVTRQFFPAQNEKGAVALVTLKSAQDTVVTIPKGKQQVLGYRLGTKGVYVSRLQHTAEERVCLKAEKPYTYTVYLSAAIGNADDPVPDGRRQLEARYRRVAQLCEDSLVISTGIAELDAMARYARLRAGESIFDTLSGKLHSPGGRTYYAAVWCNDQVEYASPHFAMTGDRIAIEASLNAYRAYVPFMTENYSPIPSSIIAEGLDIWNGAGDRGDAAMYLYGASAFCLYLGDRTVARELYGPIRWCAEYCARQVSAEGVIRSDTDELEKRIPTDGYANLSTSCLTYGGLVLAAKLAGSLGDLNTAAEYSRRAKKLAVAIEEYFGAEIHGYRTYRYSKGFDTLRSWICLPLCMGIFSRAEGTMEALWSPYLWTEDGSLSCEVSQDCRDITVWDRSTLYGFKAAFLAGQGQRVVEPLLRYCRKRLLCDRVPYAVEAYPEGGKRQLSAESALFMRALTEGMLGIQPESLDAFSFVPQLPEGVPFIHLKQLYIAGCSWEILVTKDQYKVLRNDEMFCTGLPRGQRVVLNAQ